MQLIECGGNMSTAIQSSSACHLKVLLESLVVLCFTLGLDLVSAVEWKLGVNRRRYTKTLQEETAQFTPTGWCCSQSFASCFPSTTVNTGEAVAREMHKQGPVLVNTPSIQPADLATIEDSKGRFWSKYTQLSQNILDFAKERSWEHLYTKRSVAISLYTEMGELAAILEWGKPALLVDKDITINNLASEIADVTIYTFHYIRVLGMECQGLESEDSELTCFLAH